MIIYRYFIENSKLYIDKFENVKSDNFTYYDDGTQNDICSVSKLDSNLVETMFYDNGCISGLFYTTEQDLKKIKRIFLDDVVKRQLLARDSYELKKKQLDKESEMISKTEV